MNINLTEIRRRYNLDKNTFATVLDCSVEELSKMEAGVKEIPLKFAPVLAMLVFPDVIEDCELREVLIKQLKAVNGGNAATRNSDNSNNKGGTNLIDATHIFKGIWNPESEESGEGSSTGDSSIAEDTSCSKDAAAEEVVSGEEIAVEERERVADAPGNYIVYTDGGCDSNPGGRGGFGAVIVNIDTGEIAELSEGYRSSTNNRMEVMAAIKALSVIPPDSNVHLVSDSAYLLKTMAGEFRKKKNIDLWEMLDLASEGKNIELEWVKGHNGHEGNERCDALAMLARKREPLLVDSGYEKSIKNTESSQNSEQGSDVLNMPIAIENLREKKEFSAYLPAEEYAEAQEINVSCAKSLYQFWKEYRPGFMSYVNLKTGGHDKWSSVSAEEIIRFLEYKEDVVERIREYLPEQQDINTCLRWNVRGLGLKDAVRKTLVDKQLFVRSFG